MSAYESGPSGTVDLTVMPGYKGEYNDAIRARIEALSVALGQPDLASKFPHLYSEAAKADAKDMSWHKAFEGKPNPADFIDHTVLKADASAADIAKLCAEARENKFFAVCVNGSRVEQSLAELKGSDVKVAAVIGFPLGAGMTSAKVAETAAIIAAGAHEIDMVMNIGYMKDKNYKALYEDIKAVNDATTLAGKGSAILKVIFETCILSNEEIIDASIISIAAGVRFIKTSTGFNKEGATPAVVDLMLAVAGNEAETKAAGGVRDGKTAHAYITAGVRRIGTSSGVAILKSSL